MAHDLSVAPLTGSTGITPLGSATEFPEPAPAPSQVAAASLIPNPSLRIDAALGIVVIEFHGDGGKVLASIPSQQQLDAYSSHTLTVPTPTRRTRIA